MTSFKFSLKLLLLLGITLASAVTNAGEKWYRVEILVIEAKDKSALAEEWPLEPGKPSLSNSVSLNSDLQTDFDQLPNNQLTLGNAKKRLQQNYRLIMHKGWRQKLADRENAPKIHLHGGQIYNTDDEEVDGIIKLSAGRYIHVDADLLFHKPMRIVSGTEDPNSTARFAEVANRQNWQNDPSARLQAFRLKETSRLKADEVHYIDHPLYGIIIVVSPEKEKLTSKV
jgi:hypothetical protein